MIQHSTNISPIPISEFSSFSNVHSQGCEFKFHDKFMKVHYFLKKSFKYFGGLLFLADACSGMSGGFGIGVAAEGTLPGSAGCSGVLGLASCSDAGLSAVIALGVALMVSSSSS